MGRERKKCFQTKFGGQDYTHVLDPLKYSDSQKVT